MIEMMFRPMTVEPSYKNLGRCSIRPTHTDSMKAIRYELARIGATDVIIEAGFAEHQIRNDGYPYSGAKPNHSTVRISFRRGGKTPMAMTCGGHSEWYFNVYLIAKTLEALRAVDRYGCTQGGEQYEGWSQLPPPPPPADPTPGRAQEWRGVASARRWMGDLCGMPEGTPIEVLYRECAKKAHPDAGGSNELMAKVTRARDYIEEMGER